MKNNRSDVKLPLEFLDYDREVPDQLSAASPGKDGVLKAVFKVGEDGRTFLKDQFVKLPFHITKGLYNDENLRDMVFLYVQTPSGGIAQGDRHVMEIEALENSKVHITTQGANRVHGMNKNYGLFSVDLKIHENAYLEFLPDPTILYRDSRYLQYVNLEIGDGGTALYAEVLIPGRVAMGEAFQYEVYYSKVLAKKGEGRIFEDNILLMPKKHGLKTPGLLGDFDTLGNLYIISPRINAKELSDIVHELAVGEKGVLASTSTLPNEGGVLLRALGNNSRTVSNALIRAWNEVRQFILGVEAPRIRKY